MSPMRRHRTPAANCFPRVSGDEPGFEVGVEVLRGFSPRERG